MSRTLAKSQVRSNNNKVCLRRRWAFLVSPIIVSAAIISATLWQRLPGAVAKGEASGADAAIHLEAVLQVTPEYRMMPRYGYDSPQYRILYRKARLRVTAAAQWVGREMGYSAVLCSSSSGLPDITRRVTATLVNPSPDFCPVADLSGRPFTGNVISVRI